MLPLNTWRKSNFFRSAGLAVIFATAPSGNDLKASFIGANSVKGPSIQIECLLMMFIAKQRKFNVKKMLFTL